MNFETFRESLSSFARTAVLLEEFATGIPDPDIAPSRGETFELLQHGKIWEKAELRIDTFKTLHKLTNRFRGVSDIQASWNSELIDFCGRLGCNLIKQIRWLHTDVNRVDRAQKHLGDMRRRLKEASRLGQRRQHRWNKIAIAAVSSLVDAHRCLGVSKVERLGVKGGLFDRVRSRVKGAARSNERSRRGIRWIFGKYSINQRRFNSDCYFVVEQLSNLQIKLDTARWKQYVGDERARLSDCITRVNNSAFGHMNLIEKEVNKGISKLQVSITSIGARVCNLENELCSFGAQRNA
jgi:hypothetical protein